MNGSCALPNAMGAVEDAMRHIAIGTNALVLGLGLAGNGLVIWITTAGRAAHLPLGLLPPPGCGRPALLRWAHPRHHPGGLEIPLALRPSPLQAPLLRSLLGRLRRHLRAHPHQPPPLSAGGSARLGPEPLQAPAWVLADCWGLVPGHLLQRALPGAQGRGDQTWGVLLRLPERPAAFCRDAPEVEPVPGGFLVSFAIIATSYVVLTWKLRRRSWAGSPRTFALVLAVVALFFVCWLPHHIWCYSARTRGTKRSGSWRLSWPMPWPTSTAISTLCCIGWWDTPGAGGTGGAPFCASSAGPWLRKRWDRVQWRRRRAPDGLAERGGFGTPGFYPQLWEGNRS
ncbi:uncharacterized protein LOC122457390 [Dermochelys coriacea]|uniref:uncharacterized protein LOC122457390 n=1 Tax=Dermochelys coriacea TaxID=27794 RepID=UPI001CA7E266|nr:uncharacterized protein LOC122457390 [Dermochelys coriacea]